MIVSRRSRKVNNKKQQAYHTKMPGYKIYLQENGEIRKGLRCSYCRLVLRDPIQTSETGQRYCRECFTEVARSSTAEIDPRDTAWPDKAIKKEVANLLVICENNTAGCQWKGSFKEFLDHIQSCQYIAVECRNVGCTEQLVVGKVEHQLSLQQLITNKDYREQDSFKSIETQEHDESLQTSEFCQQEEFIFKRKCCEYDEVEYDKMKILDSQVSSIVHADDDRISNLEENYGKIQTEITTTKSLINQSCAQVEVFSWETEKIKREQFLPQKFTGGELMPYNNNNSMDYIRQVEEKTLEVEHTLNIPSAHHSELELQLQASFASSIHNGAFLWHIPGMRSICDAKIGRITSIYSPPFYTGRNCYKMCIRAYLNGDGSGEGTHLSTFFIIMKSEYDLLQWLFNHEVSIVLIDQDQRKHLVQTFKPNLQSSSFQRPKSDMNVASGCPEFVELSVLDDPFYVKDNVMYIEAIVDTSNIDSKLN